MLAHFGPKTCQAALESTAHLKWIKNVLSQLPALKTLTIDALLCYQGWTAEQKEKLLCEEIVEAKVQSYYALEKLTRFTLAKYDFNAQPDLKGERVMMLEWTPKGGQVKFGEKKEEEKKEDVAGDEEMKTVTVMVTVEEADEVEGGDDGADNDGNQASGEDEDEASGEEEDDSDTEVMNVDEDDANDAGDEDEDENPPYSWTW